MKKTFLVSLIILLNLSSFSQQIKVAILDFENTSGIAKYDGLGKAMSSMLITDIEANVSSKRLQLVERTQIQKILKEQNFQSSSAVDKNTAVKAGKILGVKYLLVGDIYILNDVLVLNARLTDAETGNIKFSKKQEGKLSTWLMLKTNIAKELASSISMPFTVPNIPDQEINVATITTFGNAVMAKDEGKIDKAEELLKTVQEFNPDFKYFEDLKFQLDELKKQVEKNTESIQILEKSGGRVLNATNYNELKNNLENTLTSNSEQTKCLMKLINNYPFEFEKDISSLSFYPKVNHLGYSEDSFLNEILILKIMNFRTTNKKIFGKYVVNRLITLIYYVSGTYRSKSHLDFPIEKRMPNVSELLKQLRQLIDSLEINESEKDSFGLLINRELLTSIVPFELRNFNFTSDVTSIKDKEFFITLSNINSYNLIDNEIKYYCSKLTTNDSFIILIFSLIDNYSDYLDYIDFIRDYTSHEYHDKYKYISYADKIEPIFNHVKLIDNFHVIKLTGCDPETKKIVNDIFIYNNKRIKLDINKFQKYFSFSIIESNFFNHFMSSVNELERQVEGEQIIDCRRISKILLHKSLKSDKYEIICFF
jgi:TolB-like protein